MKKSGYYENYLNDKLIKVVKEVQCKNCDEFFKINSILKHLNHHGKKEFLFFIVLEKIEIFIHIGIQTKFMNARYNYP